jgi:hypothetical protein
MPYLLQSLLAVALATAFAGGQQAHPEGGKSAAQAKAVLCMGCGQGSSLQHVFSPVPPQRPHQMSCRACQEHPSQSPVFLQALLAVALATSLAGHHQAHTEGGKRPTQVEGIPCMICKQQQLAVAVTLSLCQDPQKSVPCMFEGLLAVQWGYSKNTLREARDQHSTNTPWLPLSVRQQLKPSSLDKQDVPCSLNPCEPKPFSQTSRVLPQPQCLLVLGNANPVNLHTPRQDAKHNNKAQKPR